MPNYSLFLVFALFLFISVDAKRQKSSINGSTYMAGVVEFHPESRREMYTNMKKNIKGYLELIHLAGEEDVDILVFPEATLNRNFVDDELSKHTAFKVPHPMDEANPCLEPGEHAEMMEQLSCAARNESLYLVVNVAELAYCNETKSSNCPEEKFFLFNTNVVFDRNGTVISRYRKINLYGETGFTPSLTLEHGNFMTDFGVRFGHFICFDILFANPAVQQVEQDKIRNFIFPTMWYSEMPFLTAVTVQESYAYVHDVNLLAAGANNPDVGSTGTGIYSGKLGALAAIMNAKQTTNLLISEVPKIPGYYHRGLKSKKLTREVEESVHKMDNLFLKQDNMSLYVSQVLDENLEQQFINLTHGELECHFHVKLDKSFAPNTSNVISKSYIYRALVFDGVKSYGSKTGGESNCAIIACSTMDINSCGTRFTNYTTVVTKVKFQRIAIIATVPKPKYNDTLKASNRVYHPITIDSSIYPIGVNNFDYTITQMGDTSKNQVIKMVLLEPRTNLMTFGFMGRDFEKDDLPRSRNSGIVNSVNAIYVFLAATFVILYHRE